MNIGLQVDAELVPDLDGLLSAISEVEALYQFPCVLPLPLVGAAARQEARVFF